MKKTVLVSVFITLIVLGLFWYETNQKPKEDESPHVQPVTTTSVTSSAVISPSSKDQAELYLEQSEEGIKILEELGVK